MAGLVEGLRAAADGVGTRLRGPAPTRQDRKNCLQRFE
jgi:hypothetical protein